jgi:hypothetical protein
MLKVLVLLAILGAWPKPESSYSPEDREKYLVDFALKTWPQVERHKYQASEMRAIAREISRLPDASLLESTRLINIAAMESYFDRKAKGKAGECGAWQIMNGSDCSAARALWLMRNQGMLGYVGCPRETPECLKLISHRVDRADLFRMGFDP